MSFFSLRFLLPALFLVYVLLNTALALFSDLPEAKEQAKEEATAHMNSQLSRFQGTLNHLLAANDQTGIRQELANLGSHPHLRFALLADRDGTVIGSTRFQWRQLSLSKLLSPEELALVEQACERRQNTVRYDNKSHLVTGYSPITLGKNEAAGLRPPKNGILILRVDNGPTIRRTEAFTYRHIFIDVAALLVITALLWIFFHLTVSRNVDRLLRASQRFLDGDHAARAHIRGPAEIERLGRIFDDFAEQIGQAHAAQKEMLIQQSKMAAMGEMIGAIAHQWKQPLNALAIQVQDIMDAYEYRELDEAYIDKSVKKIMDQIRYMGTTVDDFRNFFHPVRNPVVFSLPETAAEVEKLLRTQLANHGIRLEERFAPECPRESLRAAGLPNEFKQALINLFNNAKDAIHARQDQKEIREGIITIEYAMEGEHPAMTVRDNGGGIAPEVMEHLFEPYVTTKKEQEGTGIGLYLTRMIIEEKMGGSIRAANEGDGAAFRMRFPPVSGEGERPAG